DLGSRGHQRAAAERVHVEDVTGRHRLRREERPDSIAIARLVGAPEAIDERERLARRGRRLRGLRAPRRRLGCGLWGRRLRGRAGGGGGGGGGGGAGAGGGAGGGGECQGRIASSASRLTAVTPAAASTIRRRPGTGRGAASSAGSMSIGSAGGCGMGVPSAR